MDTYRVEMVFEVDVRGAKDAYQAMDMAEAYVSSCDGSVPEAQFAVAENAYLLEEGEE